LFGQVVRRFSDSGCTKAAQAPSCFNLTSRNESRKPRGAVMKRLIFCAFLLLFSNAAQAALKPEERAMLDRISSDPEARAEAIERLSKPSTNSPRKNQSVAAARVSDPLATAKLKDKPQAHTAEQSPCAGFLLFTPARLEGHRSAGLSGRRERRCGRSDLLYGRSCRA
jgi:hypothetical protein